MLWDVDSYKVMLGLTLLMVGSIVMGTAWLIVTRAVQRRSIHRLEAAKDQSRSLVLSIVQGRFQGDINSLRYSPQTIQWQAIQELLLEQMQRSFKEDQQKITQAFERLRYVDFYLQELGSGVSWRRAVAAQRLGIIQSSQAISGLSKALEDHDPDVRQVALQALGQIPDLRALEKLVNKLRDVTHRRGLSRRLLMASLIPFGKGSVPFLIDKLSDPSDAVRALVADALGEIGSPQAMEVLVNSLADESPDVRAKAAHALGRIGHPLAVRPLIGLLSDQFWYVRLQAAKSLGHLGSPQAIYDLSLRLTDSHALIRSATAEALIRIGPLALQALTIHLLYTHDRYTREQVCEALQQSGLIDQWIDNLNAVEESVRRQVGDLLVAVAKGSRLSVLINALQNHSNPQVRAALVEILGKSGSLASRRAIHRAALYDPEVTVREYAKAVILKATKNTKEGNALGNLCHQP